MKKKTRLNLTETQTCHPEFISGSNDLPKANTLTPLPRGEGKRKAAFTLAETLITLTVIGIIAMITVPAIISKHNESANRTKIKKAMSVYDTAVNKMVIENGIKNNEALVSTAGNADNNCAGSSPYFKISQGSGCEFKTSDGLWWNIEDITHPIVAFKQADLTAEKAAGDNKDAFYFVGRIDEATGILRVNDYTAESETNKEYLGKLYNFVKPEVGGSSSGEVAQKSFLDNCDKIDDTHYSCGGTTFVSKTGDGSCYTFEEWANAEHKGTQSCGTDKTVWVPENPIPENVYGADADSDENCATSTFKDCKFFPDNYNAAKRYCESKGTHLATVGELKSLGYTSGDFWAAEEYDSEYAYLLYDGDVYHDFKYYDFAVVCVGN